MTSTATTDSSSKEELIQLAQAQAQEIDALKRQLEWFKRQLFGRKSEKRLVESPSQLHLTELFPQQAQTPPPAKATVEVPAHERRKKHHPGTPADSGLRFDEATVPVTEIRVPVPELEGPDADQYEIIREEATYRLAQRPGSYEVLKYKRPVLKHRETEKLTTTPAPPQVFDKSCADVSFVAGLLVDKFIYHLPLYRQHQRLAAHGIVLSRTTLTHLVERAAQLLTPIAEAVRHSVLESRVLAMDETPTRAGRKKPPGARHGQMKVGYYWPLYGERDEVYFSFSETRATQHAVRVLGEFSGTLISDGYAAYAKYAASRAAVTHAACWTHTRRYFEKALDDEPDIANQGLDFISALYAHERVIREKALAGEKQLAYRGEHQKLIVDRFFLWCRDQLERPDLIAQESPIITAVRYALNQEAGLRVFLGDPDVPLDTNHLERALRVIPMGRKAWLFSWTEVGARYVGAIQTLLVTCRLHGVNPYTYLVDVLQRVGRHPAARVAELTPRLWKAQFAANPMRSDVER